MAILEKWLAVLLNSLQNTNFAFDGFLGGFEKNFCSTAAAAAGVAAVAAIRRSALVRLTSVWSGVVVVFSV